jgi:Cof subfamily protein (haloacid dehalogenase superfamily)
MKLTQEVYNWLGKMASHIQLVALDIDGTLLNNHHVLTPRTEKILQKVYDLGIQIVMATGRSPTYVQELKGSLKINGPGVYVQGLLVLDSDGGVIWEHALDVLTARRIISFAKENGLTPLLYSGPDILVESHSYYADSLIPYHEPVPEAVGPLEEIPGKYPVHKILLLDSPERISMLRPDITEFIDGQASITQALPIAVEILPYGSSKGDGLRRLLNHYNISPAAVMAFGDGENDIEMIRLAGIGVAMGNAPQHVQAAADMIAPSNDEDGVASILECLVLQEHHDLSATIT